MSNCRIFDDQYGEKIYEGIHILITKYHFPVKNNVVSPIPFVDKIQNGDLILLDNYFPGETWEEPLGDIFLQKYIEKGLDCKIICISDYGKTLLDKYFSWEEIDKKGDIIGYIPSKDPKEILKALENF